MNLGGVGGQMFGGALSVPGPSCWENAQFLGVDRIDDVADPALIVRKAREDGEVENSRTPDGGSYVEHWTAGPAMRTTKETAGTVGEGTWPRTRPASQHPLRHYDGCSRSKGTSPTSNSRRTFASLEFSTQVSFASCARLGGRLWELTVRSPAVFLT